jgi:heterodisulfide reductase subunit C
MFGIESGVSAVEGVGLTLTESVEGCIKCVYLVGGCGEENIESYMGAKTVNYYMVANSYAVPLS